METGLKGGSLHKSVALQDIFAVHVLGMAQCVLSKTYKPRTFFGSGKASFRSNRQKQSIF